MIASTTQDHTLNGCAVFRYSVTLIHFSHSLSLLKEGGFDLVVLGSSGHSKVWAMFLGTTAEKVSRHVPCTVLIVR